LPPVRAPRCVIPQFFFCVCLSFTYYYSTHTFVNFYFTGSDCALPKNLEGTGSKFPILLWTPNGERLATAGATTTTLAAAATGAALQALAVVQSPSCSCRRVFALRCSGLLGDG